jgi:predicted alpha/beta-fold hydrolase
VAAVSDLNVAIDDAFRPPAWLRSGHVQSILPSLSARRLLTLRRAAPLRAASRERLLECDDGVRLLSLQAVPRTQRRPPSVVMLLHGWEGSGDSLYVLSLAQELFARGHVVIRLNLRDHGPTHHLNPEIFHSCRLPEVLGAVRAVQRQFPAARLSLGGFSLGGNFALRVAAEARRAGIRLASVVAVSPVLEPAATLAAMERGLRIYERYFMLKWRRSLRKKQRAWPDRYDFSTIGRRTNVRRMTEELVRRHTEYGTLETYLSGYAITGNRLAGLDVRSTIITALDDPLIPAGDLAHVATPLALRFVVTRYGGHCGFVDRVAGPSYADRLAVKEFAAAIEG